MSAMVTVTINKRQMADLARVLKEIPRKMPVVISRSLNRTIAKAKVDTAREIGNEIRMKKMDIKRRITIQKASRSRLRAVMKISKRRVPLLKYAARQLKKGVSYAISRKGGRGRIRMGFKKRMPRGRIGIFRRKRPTTPRLPIMELFGPSIAGVFQGGFLGKIIGTSRISRKIKRSIGTNLTKNLAAQIDFELKKKGP